MQSWDEYYVRGWGRDPELARERMDMLRFEEAKAMFNRDSTPIKTDSPERHELSFTCQCHSCVQKRTLTMNDRLILWSIGVAWSKADVTDIQAGRYERPHLPKPQARQIRRTPKTEDLWKA